MNTKIFYIFLLVFALISAINAQQYDFDAVEKYRMAKGKVRTQTQYTYDYEGGKPSTKGFKSSVTKFDQRGNVTEIANYNAQGKIISLIVSKYDSRDNRVIYERYQGGGSEKKLQYSQTTAYDSRGNKLKESGFDGAATYENIYRYEGGKVVEIIYNSDKAVTERRQIKYSGNKAEISIFDKNDNLEFRQENTYNDKGMLISEIKTGGKGNIIHTLNLKYNTAGDLTEEIKKRADNKLDYQKNYQYDKDNRPIKEETVNLDGTKFISHEYKYSAIGDLQLESWRKNERSSEASTKKFTYDTKGLYTDVECYFANYKLKSLYKYSYEFY